MFLLLRSFLSDTSWLGVAHKFINACRITIIQSANKWTKHADTGNKRLSTADDLISPRCHCRAGAGGAERACHGGGGGGGGGGNKSVTLLWQNKMCRRTSAITQPSTHAISSQALSRDRNYPGSPRRWAPIGELTRSVLGYWALTNNKRGSSTLSPITISLSDACLSTVPEFPDSLRVPLSWT